MQKIKVLMVCMGNICRSPTAHGVLEAKLTEAGLVDRVLVDSAGTHAYHVGEAPDGRSQAVALERGFDLSRQRARRVTAADFEAFDWLLAMDSDNYRNLLEMAPQGCKHKLRRFLEFAPECGVPDVPDPYYGGPRGFDRVFDLVEAAADGLVVFLRDELRA